MRTQTPYGTFSRDEDAIRIRATGSELWAWAHRSGSAWPCSTLATLDSIDVLFDRGDLVELSSEPSDGTADLSADELNAWSEDVIAEAERVAFCVVTNTPGYLPESEPAWFLTREEAREYALECAYGVIDDLTDLDTEENGMPGLYHLDTSDPDLLRITANDPRALDVIVDVIEVPWSELDDEEKRSIA
jgi:hypothetical protein